MADITEKTIRVAVDGVEKAVANLNKVDAIAAEITKEFQRQGKVIDKQVNAEIQKMARELANNQTQVKGLKAQFRALFKEVVSSAGSASDNISGLFAGIAGGFAGSLLAGGVEDLISLGIESLYNYVTAASDAEIATENLNNAIVDATSAVAEEAVELDKNYSILTDTTLSYEDRNTALEKLQETYPDYFDDLDLDKSTNEDLKTAYDAATDSLERRIRVSALTSVATNALTQQVKNQLEAQKIQNNLTSASTLSNWQLVKSLFAVGSTVASNVDNIQALTDANKDLNAEYQAALDLLKELGNTPINQPTTGGTGSNNTEKKRIDEIKTSVKDLTEARENYIRVTADEASSEKDIAEARVILDYYEEIAEAALRAAGSVGSLTGKTEEELKKLKAVLSKEAEDARNKIKSIISDTFGLTDESALIVYENLGAISDGSRDVFDVFAEVLKKTGEVVYDSSVKAASGGLTFIEVVNQQLIPGVEKLSKAESELADINKDLENSNASNLKNQASLIELQGLYNAAIEQGNRNLEERNKKIGDEAKQAVSQSLAAIGKSIIDFESEDFTKILQSVLASIGAEFREGGLSLVDEFNAATKTFEALIGSDAFQFDIDAAGGVAFKLTDVASEKLAELQITNEETYNNILQVVELFNKRSERLVLERTSKEAQAEAKATSIYLKNVKSKNETNLEVEKEYLENARFGFDLHYKDLAEKDSDYVDDVINNRVKLGEEELLQIRKDGKLLAEERRALAQREADVYTGTFLDALGKALEEGDYQAVQDATIKFINQRNEIIKKGEEEAQDIENFFSGLADEAEKAAIKKKEERYKRAIEYIVQYTQQAAQLIANIFALVEQRQQAVIDALQDNLSKIEDQLSQAQSNIDALEDDLEGKRSGRREAVLRGIAAEQAREEQLAAKKMELQKQLRAEEKKLANQRKAAAISQALINGALASLNIWANNTIPYPAALAFNIPTQAFVAALTATEVALIAGQKFAKGGFTGDGSYRDDTGHKVAGVVHDNEYVVPKWMVQSAQYRPLIDQLEGARTRGFADGGFTSPDYAGLSEAANPNQIGMIGRMVEQSVNAAIALAERPIYVKATEVSNISAKSAKRARVNSIGG